ncbi:MAG: VWA domain-containing protein, partial [Acidobacteria bacterium]|nr:VWA domain-containing protein [Acidobacteriota bacterium]
EVDARVFDREGRFIDDLRIEDIEVLEDGVPQAVRALVLVRGPASAATAGEPTPPADTASAPSGAPAPRPAPQTWVFVFDLNHLTPGGGFDRAKSAVETFLRDRFKDGDLGGVVAGGRMVNNRLTSVRSELVAAAATVKPLSDQRSRVIELTREWPRLNDIGEAILIADGSKDALQRAVLRACSDDPSACAMTLPDLRILDKARRAQQEAARASLDTLNSVNALASGLARIPGPKTIVFLSDGFVTSQAETTLRSVVGQTTRAGGRVYAIDVRGLNRGAAARITDQPAAGDSAGGPPAFDMGEDGPNSLAVDTGGFVIRNENNIGRALGEIAADANLYYVISYQPENANFDGKYREIEVRVKRQGAKVRARRGYLALQPSQMLIPQPIGRGSGPDPGAPTPEPPAMRVRPDGAAAAMTLAGEDLARTDALSADGWSAFQRGDVESALGPFTRAAALPNVRPWVLYVLGLSHAALNQPRDAIAAWERVRAAAPEFPPIYMDLAATYGHIGELTSALAVLRDAESRWPDDADVLNAVGVILVRRGVLDDAISAFVKAAASAPEDPVAYLNLGRAYEMRYIRGRRYIESQQRWVAPEGDRQKAIQHFERYIALKGPYADQATEAITRLKWGGG